LAVQAENMDQTGNISKTIRGGKVPVRDLAFFCRQMALVLHSDITVLEGVQILIEQTEHKLLQDALRDIYKDMEKGIPFSDALNKHRGTIFPIYMANMVVIGGKSGTSDEVFAQLADYYEKDNKVRQKVKSAAMYPAVLTVLMVGIIILLFVKILPMFNDVLHSMGGNMPALTQSMMYLSVFASRNFILILAVLIIIIACVVFYSKSSVGSLLLDKIKITAPLMRGVFTRIVTARFARSLAILLKSGVSLLSALEMMENLIDNSFVEEKFKNTREGLSQGKGLVDSLAQTGVFPPLFLRLVSVGERTGFLDEMMLKSADVFDEEVDGALERLTAFIEPAIIIVLSIVVGVILLSVMLPVISIMNAIG